jgi:DeoR/GlpR family transcriptional regulator of sugar metabolism
MLAAERHIRILDHLKSAGVVRVNDLADSLGVAPETVRRDLERLEKAGKLNRQHGGASLPDLLTVDSPFTERRTQLVKEKMQIARAALAFVEEGDTVLIDGSTTLLYFARLLPDIPITVITISYHAIAELAPRRKIVSMLLGGTLHQPSMCFFGPAAQKQLLSYHVDKAFMSCRSVNLPQGAADANEVHAGMKELMFHQAGKRFLLADHAKFGRKSLVRIAAVGDFECLITDDGLSRKMRQQFARQARKLVIASH